MEFWIADDGVDGQGQQQCEGMSEQEHDESHWPICRPLVNCVPRSLAMRVEFMGISA